MANLLSFGPFAGASIHIVSVASFLCYSITLLAEFADSTGTHCHIWNLLPSFSSTIGNYTPQRYIWRSLVGVSCVVRVFSIWLFYHNLKRFKKRGVLLQVLTLMRLAEMVGLFLLTMFASTEIFTVHAFGFCLFFLFSMINITVVAHLMANGVTGSGKQNYETEWYPIIYLCTFLGCFVTYILHNWYCVPGVYTLFGALEIVMVSSNISFWYHYDSVEWAAYTISIE